MHILLSFYMYRLVTNIDIHLLPQFVNFRLPNSIFTRGQLWPSGIVNACVRACMCVPVCPRVCQSRVCPRDNSSHVQTRITKLGPEVEKHPG